MQKKGLGRGLSALIPPVGESKTEPTQGNSPKQIAVDRISTSPFQPRRSFDEAKIDEFARDFRMSYPIWRDPDERVNSRFLAIGVPSTYLIDRDGILRWKHLGTLRATTPGFAAALEAVLKERGTSD